MGGFKYFQTYDGKATKSSMEDQKKEDGCEVTKKAENFNVRTKN